MKVIVYDINERLIDICKEKFKDTEVSCIVKSVTELDSDYIVTAGNSLGVMGGGIDLAVRTCFGAQIQLRVMDAIQQDFNGFLPIGRLVVVPLRSETDTRQLIYAPTMIHPGMLIDKEDVYYIACKIFRLALSLDNNKSIAVCGLGTATGGVSKEDFVEMLYRAYKDIIGDINE